MAETLSEMSEALAAIVEGAGPGVARVEARRRLPASGIVWSQDGVIVTAHHVIERDERITVGLGDGTSVPATLAGRDPTTDLAVLRVQASGLAPAPWTGSEGLSVGHLVLALGRPGRGVQATLGIVSALGEGWRSPMGGRLDRYVQSDVAMHPGFSGGPLVDAASRVVGLNTTALVRGVNVAVPAQTVARVVEALLAHGRVQRGYLGVGSQPARLPVGLAESLGQETGLLIVSVEPGSPAEAAGLMLGDAIVALGGQPVRHLDDLLAGLPGDLVGAEAVVRVLRGGELREVRVRVGERP